MAFEGTSGSEAQARTIGVVESLDRLAGVLDRGFTFTQSKLADGSLGDRFLSFDALRHEVQTRAHRLLSLGLKPGDRVALVIPEGEEFVPSFLSALWAGLVPVPLYPPLSLGKLDAFMESLANILNVATPRVLVAGAQVDKIIWSLVGKVPSLEKIVVANALNTTVPAGEAHLAERPSPRLPADLAFLQFTSGSTAAPKGVMVTHGSLAANARAIMLDGLSTDPRTDKGVSWLPLYHDMGLIGFVIAPICAGVSVVFIPTLSFIKNATLWLETIHKHRGTISFAPNFAYALATKRARKDQLARWDLSSMRVFGCGAEPINPDTMRAFVSTFAESRLAPSSLLPCYGMAEATLAMAFIGLEETLKTDRIDAAAYHGEKVARPTTTATTSTTTTTLAIEVVSCGRTFPGHELRAMDESGNLLPDRVVGELVFKGPSVAAGYWENAEETKSAGMHAPGEWLKTGDLGYTADGEIFVSGRLKDILILNGKNHYPQTIEWAVEEVAGVRKGSAVVFSRPGSASEELVVAIESRAGQGPNANPADAEALRVAIVSKVNEELQLKVSDVAIVPPGALPKTSSGKLQRRKTREQYLAGTLGKEGVRTMGAMGSRFVVARHVAWSLFGKARHHARGFVRRMMPAGKSE